VRADIIVIVLKDKQNIMVLSNIHYSPAEGYFYDRIAWTEHSEISHSMGL